MVGTPLPRRTRRARLATGERRTERIPNLRFAESELLVLTRAASARRMSVGAFIAQSALDLANGRLGPVRKGHAVVVSHEQAEVLRGLGRDLMDARRQLAGAATNLNQLTRAVNGGAVLPVEQIEAALAHVVEQIGRTDVVTSRVGEAARLSR